MLFEISCFKFLVGNKYGFAASVAYSGSRNSKSSVSIMYRQFFTLLDRRPVFQVFL